MNKIELKAETMVEHIHHIRGMRVMLAGDLAKIYGVETKRLNEQVKRNVDRFPSDFMFQLTALEWQNLKSQFATSSWGGTRTSPYAFTEHGAVMLASVLTSDTAIKASIEVVRAFVQLRSILTLHVEVAQKIAELERKYDGQFDQVFDVLNSLIEPATQERQQIGFTSGR
jgi:hypothetical protein